MNNICQDTPAPQSSLLSNPISVLFGLLSSGIIGWIFYYVYTLFQQHDWGQAFTKLVCFAIFFALLVILHKRQYRQVINSALLHRLECFLALLALMWIISIMAPKYLEELQNGPRVDIGYTTQNSAIMLFRDGENPYMSETINVRSELKPEHRGFHYGPGMLIGYVGSFVVPNFGYKLSNLAFLLGTMIALVLLVDGSRHAGAGAWERLSNVFIVLSLLLLPERLWYEVFTQGANDIFPIMLLLIGLVLVQKEHWLWAGIIMGFSFATKFSPAAFLLVLFLRKDIQMRFLYGCVVGVTPLMAFMLWDFKSVLNNVFILRFNLGYDSTSLYSLLPKALHYLFPTAQVVAVLILFKKNFTKTLDIDTLILHFSLLLIVIEITFKEMHTNHLIWFYPLLAYVATRYRHRLFAYPRKDFETE